MADGQITQSDRPFDAGNTSILQFLGLYLLVLAFFILLVSISTFAPVKSSAVLGSLSAQFATVRTARTDPKVFTSKSGPVIASEQFLEDIQDLFTTAIGVERITTIQPGRVMRVSMEANSLFESESTKIRDSQLALVDRIIAGLNGRPQGFHFDMEFVVGATVARDRTILIEPTLEFARAGELAQQLLARGVPPDAISIGVRAGTPDQVVIWFYVRSAEEIPTLYKKFVDEAGG